MFRDRVQDPDTRDIILDSIAELRIGEEHGIEWTGTIAEGFARFGGGAALAVAGTGMAAAIGGASVGSLALLAGGFVASAAVGQPGPTRRSRRTRAGATRRCWNGWNTTSGSGQVAPMVEQPQLIETLMLAIGATVGVLGVVSSALVVVLMRAQERRMYVRQHRSLAWMLRRRRIELQSGREASAAPSGQP